MIHSLGHPCPSLCVYSTVVYSRWGFQHALKHKLPLQNFSEGNKTYTRSRSEPEILRDLPRVRILVSWSVAEQLQESCSAACALNCASSSQITHEKKALLLYCMHCNVIICVILFYAFRIEYRNLTEGISPPQNNLKNIQVGRFSYSNKWGCH